LAEKLRFSVQLGGFDIEPVEGTQLSFSPQLRNLLPSTTTTLTVFVVPRNYAFRLASAKIEHFSAQARQDLNVSLYLGNVTVFSSGKAEPSATTPSAPVELISETRTSGTPGLPLDTISNVTGTGFHDNFTPTDTRSFGIAFENDTIKWQIKNQSDFYPHGIRLYVYGWYFQMKGRSKAEVLRYFMIT